MQNIHEDFPSYHFIQDEKTTQLKKNYSVASNLSQNGKNSKKEKIITYKREESIFPEKIKNRTTSHNPSPNLICSNPTPRKI